MQIIFAFTFNPETKEAAFTGNVEPQIALNILQNIVIAEGIRQAEEAQKKPAKKEQKSESI